MPNKKNKSKQRRSLRRRRNVKSRKVMRGRGGVFSLLYNGEPSHNSSVVPLTKKGNMRIFNTTNMEEFFVNIEYTEDTKKGYRQIKIYSIKDEVLKIDTKYTNPLVVNVNNSSGTDEIYQLMLTTDAIQVPTIIANDNRRYYIKGIEFTASV